MAGSTQTVAVAGATGRTGRLVVDELLGRGYRVSALVRTASRAPWPPAENMKIMTVDIASLPSLEQALQGADYVISALGSKKPFSGRENALVDNQGIQNLARAAVGRGVRHMVVISSIGAGDSRRAINFAFRLLMGPVLRMKSASEAFVRSCGISYTILRPGGLTEKELSGEVAFGEGGMITGMIRRREVARVCVDALSAPAMQNRVLEIVDAATVRASLRPHVITL